MVSQSFDDDNWKATLSNNFRPNVAIYIILLFSGLTIWLVHGISLGVEVLAPLTSLWMSCLKISNSFVFSKDLSGIMSEPLALPKYRFWLYQLLHSIDLWYPITLDYIDSCSTEIIWRALGICYNTLSRGLCLNCILDIKRNLSMNWFVKTF